MIHKEINSNPFPGLRPFQEEENYLFFGRESQVDELINKLSVKKFLAVVGTSGSGKSSLVNCGLFPALHGGYMSVAGSSWRIAKFRPGHNPIGELASALAQKDVLFTQEKIGKIPLSSIILTNLQRSKLGLIETYKQARLSPDENLLIVADQFEEIFRFRKLQNDDKEQLTDHLDNATAFVNLLLSASEQNEVPIYVVITMRSDFLGDCSTFRGLPEVINQGQYLVPRMKRKERGKAIAGPIEVAGAQVTERLLMRLVNDVGDNPDQLSILQHALNRTWAEWEKAGKPDQPIDLEHYNKIGTMSAALDQHANRAYQELKSARASIICEKMFKALTDVGIDSRGVRHPTQLGTLCEIIEATEEEVIEVIDVFRKPSRSFLMPPAETKLDKESIIDISHESFMRIWKRLIKWTDEEQDSMRTYKRLSDAAMLFKDGKSSLLGDPYLQFALNWKKTQKPNIAWASRYDDNFEEVIDFLNKSKENWLKEERDKKTKEMLEQTRREEDQKIKEEEQRRKKDQARKFGALVSLAFIVSLGFAIYGFVQKAKFEKAALEAEINFNNLTETQNKIKEYFGGSVDLDKIIQVSNLADSIKHLNRLGTTDAILLSIYKRLVKDYKDQLKKDTIKSYNDKIEILGSYDRLLTEEASDTIPIVNKLNNWKTFVSYRRRTPEADSALIKIKWYENYKAENAMILNENNFVINDKRIKGDNNKPTDFASSFQTGKIYLRASVNAPVKNEALTVKWYTDQVITKLIVIEESNTTDRGFRISHEQTYNSSRRGKKNEVRLYNGNNKLIGRKVFEIQ